MNLLLTDRPLTVSLPEGWDMVDLSQQTIAPVSAASAAGPKPPAAACSGTTP